MSMNIKNEETHRLAKELAAITGESVTEAVTVAVKDRLERVRHRKDAAALSAQLMALGRSAAEHMDEPFRSVDHGELLYDENGLPN